MKNRYIISIFVTLLFLSVSSCDDFLEEDAKGLLTPENYFQNEAEAYLALNGLHAGIPTGGGLGDHLGTDIGVTGRFAIPGGWRSAVYEYDADNAAVRNTWTNGYANIKNANFALDGVEKSDLSEEIKEDVISQILFYRALFYFDLVMQYSDIVYWRESLQIDEVALLGTTDGNIILADMISDLEKAISSGYMTTERWNDTKGNPGRPTIWAARMLKAYIHIWQKEWPEARAELIEIYSNSPHLALNPDYANMYREGNEFHNEIIFGKEFLTGNENNRRFEQFHYNNNGENKDAQTAMKETGVFARSAAQTLRKSFADTYADTDARKIFNVWGTHTLNDGTDATFNWIYIPKMMRSVVPLSDPIMINPDPNGQSSEPGRLFTLANAYLLLSEVEFMIGGSSPEALEPINKVRVRANLLPLDVLTMQDIINERAWELVGEGFIGRKKDLIRWGILESTVAGIPAAEEAAGAYQLAIDRAQDEADIINGAPIGKYQIFPVPQDDILKSQDIGGALVQNPIWQ